MRARVEVAPYRHRDDRHIGVRVHDLQRDEHTVVPPVRRVEPMRDTRLLELRGDSCRDVGRARRRVGELVGVRWETAVVVDERR